MDENKHMLPVHNEDQELQEPLMYGDDGSLKGIAKKHWHNHRCAIISGVATVVTLMVVLISVFVGGQSFAQNTVATSDLKLETMSITSFTPTSFVANVDVSMDNRSPVGATIHKSNVDLKFGGKKFAVMQMKQLKVKAAATTNFPLNDCSTTITDKAGFTAFATALLKQDSIDLEMDGKIKASAMGLTFGVDLKKTVSLKGINNFNDPAPIVTDNWFVSAGYCNTSATDYCEELVLGIVANMTNPSSSSFNDLGQMKFDIVYNGKVVGLAETPSMHVGMQQGVNVIEMRAKIQKRADNEDACSAMLSSFMAPGITTMNLKGRKDSVSVALLQDAMETVLISNSFNGLASLRKPPKYLTVDASSVDYDGLPQSEVYKIRGSVASLTTYRENRQKCGEPDFIQYSSQTVLVPNIVPANSSNMIPPEVHAIMEQCFNVWPEYYSNLPKEKVPDSIRGVYTPAQVLVFNPLNATLDILGVDANVTYTPGDDPASGLCNANCSPNQALMPDACADDPRPGCLEDMLFARMIKTGTAAKPLLSIDPFTHKIWSQNLCVLAGMNPVLVNPDGSSNPTQFFMNLIGQYIQKRYGITMDYATTSFPLPSTITAKTTVLIGGVFKAELSLVQSNIPGEALPVLYTPPSATSAVVE